MTASLPRIRRVVDQLPAAGLLRAGVIGEARRRQRRRRQLITAILVAVGGSAILLQSSDGGSGVRLPRPQIARLTTSMLSRVVLASRPDLYVNCPVADSIACDRVHVSINLRSRAVSVTATIAGQSVVLDRRGDLPAPTGPPRTEFDGLLQPARLTTRLHVIPQAGPDGRRYYYGSPRQPQIPIELRITSRQGQQTSTQMQVPLNAAGG